MVKEPLEIKIKDISQVKYFLNIYHRRQLLGALCIKRCNKKSSNHSGLSEKGSNHGWSFCLSFASCMQVYMQTTIAQARLERKKKYLFCNPEVMLYHLCHSYFQSCFLMPKGAQFLKPVKRKIFLAILAAHFKVDTLVKF